MTSARHARLQATLLARPREARDCVLPGKHDQIPNILRTQSIIQPAMHAK